MRANHLGKESIPQILFISESFFLWLTFLRFFWVRHVKKQGVNKEKCSLGNLLILLEEYQEIPSYHSSPT